MVKKVGDLEAKLYIDMDAAAKWVEELREPVNQLGVSLQELGKQIAQVTAPILSVSLETMRLAAEAQWERDIERIQPALSEDYWQSFYIAANQWDQVDFDRITPDQRWEYQKWVLGSPIRILRWFYYEMTHDIWISTDERD